MKILYIADSSVPSRTANSIHVMKMCQAFARGNHEVVLAVPGVRRYMEPEVDDIYRFYDVDQLFTVERLARFPSRGQRYVHGFLAANRATN